MKTKSKISKTVKAKQTNGAEAILAIIAKGRAAGRSSGADLSGSFTIAPEAIAAGLDALPLRPGSCRYELLAAMFAAQADHGNAAKTFSRAEIDALIGAQSTQVLNGLTMYGILKAAS